MLLLPIVGSLPADDLHMRRTIATVERSLGTNGLLRRWTGAKDGAFLLCSFWLADCLARAGEVDRAIRVLEGARARADDVGLFSEEIDLDDGAPIENFPPVVGANDLSTSATSARRASGAAHDHVHLLPDDLPDPGFLDAMESHREDGSTLPRRRRRSRS